MPFYFDRVQETTTTAGTGTITLAGAVAGYRTFASVFASGANRVFYFIVDGTAWEVGDGTYTTSGTTLARQRVFASSNAGALITLSGGTAQVFLDFNADAISDVGRDLALWMAGTMQ